MKKPYKADKHVRELIVTVKKADKTISCRSLKQKLLKKHGIKISKSTVNQIIREAGLSRPVGRPVSRSFRNAVASKWAGYVFLLGADRLLNFSAKIADILSKIHPEIHHKFETLETVCQALILSRAFYNVPFRKMVDYRKEELWQILGRKVNKGLFKQFAESFDDLQPVKEQLVKEFSECLHDVFCIKVVLRNDSFYYFDGRLMSVWPNNNMPLDFCVTRDTTMCYIKSYIEGDDPWLIFDAPCEKSLESTVALFVLSFDQPEPDFHIKNLYFIGIKGDTIFSYEPSRWQGKSFIIGVDPVLHLSVSEFSHKAQWRVGYLREMERELWYAETLVEYAQDIANKKVTIRLILVRNKGEDFAQRGIYTNLDANDWDAVRVVEAYLKKCPDFEKSPLLYQNIKKDPIYLDSFLSMEKIYLEFQKIHNCEKLDDILVVFVEILGLFAKKCFFGSVCQGWSLLKMRELFFKRDGYVRRDLSGLILYKLFYGNMLQDKMLLNEAILRFNEQPVFDVDGRKFWLEIS
ncbi:MAG: helix-turn-helix domain-containing protein [Candidatus Omnitrophota bacterium]